MSEFLHHYSSKTTIFSENSIIKHKRCGVALAAFMSMLFMEASPAECLVGSKLLSEEAALASQRVDHSGV